MPEIQQIWQEVLLGDFIQNNEAISYLNPVNIAALTETLTLLDN